MIFSGSNNFRSLPEFKEWSFNATISLNSVSGSGFFGFSGTGVPPSSDDEVLGFKFISGKIKDPEDNLVFSYQKDRDLTISGDVFPDRYVYFINNNPINLSGNKNTFSVKKLIYETKDCTINSNLNFYAKSRPTYSFNLPENFQSGHGFTGYLTNKNPEFNIFTGELYDGFTNFFDVSGFPTGSDGQFVISGVDGVDLGNYPVSLRLYSDWAYLEEDIVLSMNDPSQGTVRNSFNLTKLNDNAESQSGTAPLVVKSNTYRLDYSLFGSGIEINKPVGVTLEYTGLNELDYQDTERTGVLTGFQGNVVWLDSGSGYDYGTTNLLFGYSINENDSITLGGSGGGGTGVAGQINFEGGTLTSPVYDGNGNPLWSGWAIESVTITDAGFNYMTGAPAELFADTTVLNGRPELAGKIVMPVLASGAGSGSGDYLSALGYRTQRGASGIMLLEEYNKTFHNTYNLKTGLSLYDTDFKDSDYVVIKTDAHVPYVTGYRNSTHFPYKPNFDATLSSLNQSMVISVEHTSYYDTRQMYALLKVSGASDDSNPRILVSDTITGIK